jgi:hypothetical protein
MQLSATMLASNLLPYSTIGVTVFTPPFFRKLRLRIPSPGLRFATVAGPPAQEGR